MTTCLLYTSPQFVPGQTPVVAARPYVRFATPRINAVEQMLGKDAPTRASSETPDHPGRLANDGDEITFWSAVNSEPEACLLYTSTGPLHVTWYGTFVTTPGVSAASGAVSVKTEIRNDAVTGKDCMVESDVVDANGGIVALSLIHI